MSNETLFYVCGIVLAVSAVTVSILGLKLKDFPGKALPIVILWFAIFVVGATTFATRYSGEEHEAKAAEYKKFNEEVEKDETSGPFEESAESGESEQTEEGAEEPAGKTEGAKAGGTTLQVEADPTGALAFNTTELTAKAGKVTIDFTNESPIPHNVVIEENGKELAGFEPLAEGKASETADLEPGTYTFLCTVPGHAQAGMEGTLVVQ